MNNLSLLILLAEMVGSLAWFFGIMVFLCVLILLFSGDSRGKMECPCYGLAVEGPAYFWKTILVGVISLFLCIFTPSSKTIYMIAASEFGEEIVTSPEVRDMANDLRMIIKDMAGQVVK